MSKRTLGSILIMSICTSFAIAQDKTALPPQGSAAGHEPPPQAYEDCKGKKSGDVVQHTTREGKVTAICAESPKGLVARPTRPKGSQPGNP